MTPAYLNPSPSPFRFVELKDDQHIEHFSPPQQAASSLSCPFFFNLTDQDQRGNHPKEPQQNQQKVDNYVMHGGSSDHHVIPSSSLQPAVADGNNGNKLWTCKRTNGDESKSNGGSMKWMSSKMRLMRKMMNSNCSGTDKPDRIVHKFNYRQQDNSEIINSSYTSNDTVRVCSDCNTTKTPLWRSGPRGPKSLCNACGIRQRKARRAAAAAVAANGTDNVGTDTSTSSNVHNKEKKSRTSYVTQQKKHSKLLGSSQRGKKLSFEDFALSLSKNSAIQRVFPQDEEDAAILLMALSCGLIHS